MGKQVRGIAAEATKQALKGLPHSHEMSRVIAAVGSAAGQAAFRTAEHVGHLHSVEGVADLLGVSTKLKSDDDAFSARYLGQRVPSQERLAFGYGTLPDTYKPGNPLPFDYIPDSLINQVNRKVMRLGSESVPPEPSKKIAAHVMAVMWQHRRPIGKDSSPIISFDRMYEKVRTRLDADPIFAEGTVLEAEVIETYGSALMDARHITERFILAAAEPVPAIQAAAEVIHA